MLRLTRRTMLALEAVLDVAYNARPHPVQAREITARQGIPQRYLEQVLQRLVRKGILRGVRGPRGGYTLAKERRRISLGDVLRVVSELDLEEDAGTSKSTLGEQIIAPIWEEIQTEIFARYDALTIEDLCQQAADKGVQRTGGETYDFSI